MPVVKKMKVKKMKEGGGKGMAEASPQRERVLTGSFVLRFYLSLAGGNLRGGRRGGFQPNIHRFSRCAFPGCWSPLIGQCQGRSLVIAAGPGISHLVLLLFWTWS